MALELSAVHKYGKDVRTGTVVILPNHPYVRFTNHHEPQMFWQQGQIYGAGGYLVREVPLWVYKAAEKMDHKVRKEIGIDLDVLRGRVKELKGEKKPAAEGAPATLLQKQESVLQEQGPIQEQEQEEGEPRVYQREPMERPDPVVLAKDPAPAVEAFAERVRVKLMEFDHSNDKHWTRTGMPDLNTLHLKVGRYVSRGALNLIDPNFRRRIRDG